MNFTKTFDHFLMKFLNELQSDIDAVRSARQQQSQLKVYHEPRTETFIDSNVRNSTRLILIVMYCCFPPINTVYVFFYELFPNIYSYEYHGVRTQQHVCNNTCIRDN